MNRALLEKRLAESGWDGIVVLSPENVFYQSGSPTVLRMKMFQYRPNSPRMVIVVQRRNEEPTLITPALDERVNKEVAWAKDVRGYKEYIISPMEMLAQVVKETGLGEGLIGLEIAAMGVSQYQRLTELLPYATFQDCGPLMAEVRSIKTPDEVAIIKEAVDLMDDAFLETFASAHIGESEAELDRRMFLNLISQGFDDVRGWTLLGERATDVHRIPSEAKTLEPGDIVRTDYVAAFNHYIANLSRVAVGGQPTADHRDTYQALLEVERSTAQFMRPGVRACDVYTYCHEAILERGLEHTLSLVGHNIGLECQEDPMIVASDTREIKADMVISLEPCIGPNYHIQDQFLVTDEGTRLLSDKFNTDEMFIIE